MVYFFNRQNLGPNNRCGKLPDPSRVTRKVGWWWAYFANLINSITLRHVEHGKLWLVSGTLGQSGDHISQPHTSVFDTHQLSDTSTYSKLHTRRRVNRCSLSSSFTNSRFSPPGRNYWNNFENRTWLHELLQKIELGLGFPCSSNGEFKTFDLILLGY